MNRLDFIRISAGASVIGVFGTLPGLSGTGTDTLERWGGRYKADIKQTKEGRSLVAKPLPGDLGRALQELEEMTDGALRCMGNQVVGIFSGRPFTVEFAAVS